MSQEDKIIKDPVGISDSVLKSPAIISYFVNSKNEKSQKSHICRTLTTISCASKLHNCTISIFDCDDETFDLKDLPF